MTYDGVSTLLLKRRTSQNIVWGRRGRLYAGTDRLVWPSLVLFLI